MRAWLFALAACNSVAQTAQPITNGALDSADPAVMALVDAEDVVGCSATLIAPHTGVTAAHCLAGRDPRTLRAFFGSSFADGGTLINVSDARIDPAFDGATLLHDVALITLRDEGPATPLALDTRTVDTTLINKTVRVVGFGATADGAADTGIKRTGTARISDVQPDEIFAVPAPSQPCRGDSGGPALFTDTEIVAVVSHGDSACVDHAVFARLDTERDLVDTYIADTAPGTAQTGNPCFYDMHCAEGPCLQTKDDPLLYFCSRACANDDECPPAMRCADDGCRYPEPSPGALGSTCERDDDCTSQRCYEQACTISCFVDANVCPDGFECVGVGGLTYYCLEKHGCAGCNTGSPGLAVFILFWLTRRSARSASLRGNRATRSAKAR